MTKAVIIDDEKAMLETNCRLLEEHFPDIELVGTAGSVAEGIDLILEKNPQLVLLDIELTDGTSFEILEQLEPYSFKVVFISAYDSYALKAIKFSALDYILKPVNIPEFRKSISNAIQEINSNDGSMMQTKVLLDSYRKEYQNKKLVLKTSESLHIVEISDIMFCQSDNSYTTFYFADDEKIMVSKSIKEYDELLSSYGFFRPHQSYLVNLNHVKKVDKSDGGFIVMKNKEEIPVSVRQKKHLLKVLSQL
jgi:two-component system LytT family response regulator